MLDEKQDPGQEVGPVQIPSGAETEAEIEYLPVVGLDDEADGRDEDITPEEQEAAKALTEHTHEGVIGHRAE